MKNNQLTSNQPLPQEPTFLYSLIALALIIIALTSYFGFQQLLEKQAWVEHTNQVLHTSTEMLSSLRDAEMGAKGYVISGQERYLKSFAGSLNSADTCLGKLQALTSDNAAQQRQVRRLRELARINATLNRQVVAEKKSGNEAFLREFYASLRGRLSMDRVEEQARAVSQEERRLLGIRTQQTDRAIRFIRYSLYLSVLASLVMAYVLHRQRLAKLAYERELQSRGEQLATFNEELQATNEELAASNEEALASLEELRVSNEALEQTRTQLTELNVLLEQRVEQRTHALTSANEQISQLLESEQRSRQAIERNAHQLRLMTDALPVSIVYVDSQIRYRFANRTALQWRQGSQEPVLDKRVEEVVGTSTYQTVGHYVERALSGESVRFEMPIDYPNGKRYTDSQYVPDVQDGEVKGFYALVMDVTEQVEARREADRQRQRLHALFTEAPAPICILAGEQLVFELVNPAYQQLFPGRQLLGKPLLEALPELGGTAVWQTLRQVYRSGTTHREKEILISLARQDNAVLEDRYFTYIQQARFDERGQVDGVLVFAFEVTEQVEARQRSQQSEKEAQALAEELAAANEEIQASNEELSETNQQLSRTNADLDNFIYTASHDLKSPVSNLEGLIQVLHRRLAEKSDDSERKLMELMEVSILKFKRTIADLVEITKAQKDREEAAEAVPFAEVLSEVETDIQELIGQAQAVIEADFPVDQIRFARAKVKSILYNLLSNALKYRSPDRVASIRITTRQEAAYVVLSVQDNGLGMSPPQQAKLFTMFKRMHSHVEGTGIGLYIIKRLVENAGGRIEVESQLDTGSTFRVYFKS